MISRGRRAWRDRFPVFERYAYLNAGSMGPLSRRTVEVMAEAEREDMDLGRGSQTALAARPELRDRLRERLAVLLSTSPEKIALTCSTTEGCHLVLTGLDLGPEDEVVTTDGEHPGLLGPLASLGVQIREVEVLGRPPEEVVESILAALTPRTRLIALSHVLWLNGQVLPIAEIKRRSGLPLLVDGAQSVGAIPVHVEVADYYALSGQKWLCGPELTGAVYVADPDGLRSRVPLHPSAGADRLEMAFHPAALTAGLLTAVEDLPEDAFEANAEMARLCREALLEAGVEVITPPAHASLIAFRWSGDPEQTVIRCQQEGVVIRSLPNGWLRASCGWWNSTEDIERLISALL